MTEEQIASIVEEVALIAAGLAGNYSITPCETLISKRKIDALVAYAVSRIVEGEE